MIQVKRWNILMIAILTMVITGCGQKAAQGTNLSAAEEQTLEQPTAVISEAMQVTATAKTITDPVGQTEKQKSPIVTFIELGSVNCMPCKMMQPVMKAIEEDYGNQVKVVFHDVWTSKGRPYGEKYRIRAIPTQIFLDKNGEEFHRHTGFYPKEEIDKVLKKQGVK